MCSDWKRVHWGILRVAAYAEAGWWARGEGMDLAQGQGDAVPGLLPGEHAHFGLAGYRGFHGCAIRMRGDVVGQDQIKDG